MSELIEITRTDVIEIAGESEQLIITQPASLELVEVAQQGPTGPQGPQGPAGADGADGADGTSVVLKGSVNTVGDLPVGATQGDLYVVLADGDGYVWNGAAWANVGPIRGPKGDTGATGPQGPKGDTGATGAAGSDGANGDSAYAVALANGFVGTEAQWLASLVGPQGDTGPAGTTTWAGITDKPTTFAPSAHTHAVADVTGLQTALDDKQPIDADLTAIAALTGTAGLLKKTAANTWVLDTTGYLTSSAIGSTVQAYAANLTSWAALAPSSKVGATGGTASGLVLNDGYTEEVFAVSGTTPALSPANGSIQTWTLTGNSTPTSGTWNSGQSINLRVDDGSGFTINWSSMAVTWEVDGGAAPTLKTTGFTPIVLTKVGATIYGRY